MEQVWPSFTSAVPAPYAHVTAVARTGGGSLSTAIVAAFDDAMAERSRLGESAFHVHGFSGRKFRQFLNNLVSELHAARYLEIGLFHGASFCSAIYKNRVSALGIDNWTEYGGKSEQFYQNLLNFKSEYAEVKILDEDFRKIDFGSVGRFNILFYDGSHEWKDQYDGVILPQPALDDEFILIIDDWNWKTVRSGTFDAIRDCGLRVDFQIELRTSFNGEIPLFNGGQSEWHNGCMVAAVSKQR